VKRSLIARLMDKVEIGCFHGCWLWTGATAGGNRNWDWGGRYGHLKVDGRNVGAHRASYEVFRGVKIPAGHVTHHLCETRLCINPLHLEVVTAAVNSKISNGKSLDDALREVALSEPYM
jgi:hypothetical protein